MARNFLTSSDHLDTATIPSLSAVTMHIHANVVANGQNRHFMTFSDNTDTGNRFTLGQDIQPSVSGDVASVTFAGGSGTARQATGGAMTTGIWQAITATLNASTRAAFLEGAHKGTDSGTAAISGITKFNINGRQPDYTIGANGALAHAAIWLRVLSDVEVGWIGKVNGGGNPRYIKGLNNYWKINSASGTEADFGSANAGLTITGTTAAASNPNLGTYWTAAALGNQTWTVGTAFTAIDLTTKFEDVQSAYTSVLMILSAAVSTTTTVGTLTAGRIVSLTSSAGFTAGNYLSVGAGAPSLILNVSGSTALVADDQTYAAGATVFVYTAATASVPGVTTTGNSLAGPPTSAGSFVNLFIRATCTANTALFADSPRFNATIGSVAFTAGPSFNGPTTDGYVIGYTAGGTGLVTAVALIPGSATPTAAQVRTGATAGLVQRYTKGCTTAADTITLTGLTFPKADIYIISTISGTDSAVTGFLNQQKLPAVGRQYITFGTLSATSPFLVVTPPIAVNDVLDIDATSGPWDVDVTSAGDIELDSGGDMSRDLIHFNIFDISAAAFYYFSDSIVPINDQAPQAVTDPANAFTLFLPRNAVPTGFTFGGLNPVALDPEGDNVLYTDVEGDLAALGLATSTDGTLSGTTPDANSVNIVTILASDIYSGMNTLTGVVVVGQVQVPDVRGFDEISGDQTVAQSFMQATGIPVPSEAPVGTVVQTSPPPGTLVDPGTEVFLLISTGPITPPIDNSPPVQGGSGGNGTNGLSAKDVEDLIRADESIEKTLRAAYRSAMGIVDPISPNPLPPPKPSAPGKSTTSAAMLAALKGDGDSGVAALNKIGT